MQINCKWKISVFSYFSRFVPEDHGEFWRSWQYLLPIFRPLTDNERRWGRRQNIAEFIEHCICEGFISILKRYCFPQAELDSAIFGNIHTCTWQCHVSQGGTWLWYSERVRVTPSTRSDSDFPCVALRRLASYPVRVLNGLVTSCQCPVRSSDFWTSHTS